MKDPCRIRSRMSSLHHPFTNPPRCIHEVPSPSLLFSVDPKIQRTQSPDHNWSFCDCHPLIANTLPIEHDHFNIQSHKPIRTTGFIQPVDEESELASFESSRACLFPADADKNTLSTMPVKRRQEYWLYMNNICVLFTFKTSVHICWLNSRIS